MRNGEKPWLRQMAHDHEDVGSKFKPRHCILDGWRFASYNIKEKLKIKVAKWGTPKKNILRNEHFSVN
jgi:hypothetical protein